MVNVRVILNAVPHRLAVMQTVIRATLLTATALTVLTACGPDKQAAPAQTPAELPTQSHEHPAPGGMAVSPGGVTTAVDAPPAATESEFGQACHAAKMWMDAQHADPHEGVGELVGEGQHQARVGDLDGFAGAVTAGGIDEALLNRDVAGQVGGRVAVGGGFGALGPAQGQGQVNDGVTGVGRDVEGHRRRVGDGEVERRAVG